MAPTLARLTAILFAPVTALAAGPITNSIGMKLVSMFIRRS
jgi:hypothetical protein